MVTFLLFVCFLVSLVTLVFLIYILVLGLGLICSFSRVCPWKLGVDLEQLIAFSISTYDCKSPNTHLFGFQVFACCSFIFLMKVLLNII